MITLSADEIERFMDQGYLIKRGVLNPDLMAQAQESLWANAPRELDQHNPDSWIGPFKEICEDPESVRHGFTWKYRRQGGEAWMLRLLAKDPSVWTMAEQLLGEGCLQEPEKVRGIYCMMPEGDTPARPYFCHVDRHAFHLGVVGYIDDVEPNGGGFTVWPESHRTFYYDFDSQYLKDTANPEKHQANLAKISQQPYMDCHGDAGDIVFWHHRLGHSAGHNRSRNIRQAVLYDFRRKDLDDRLYSPPQENMWQDWDGIQQHLRTHHG